MKKGLLFVAGFILALVVAALLQLFEEFMAGDSQYTEQNNKLLEVYYTVFVFIQFRHNLINHFGVVAGLKQKHHGKYWTTGLMQYTAWVQ